MKRTFVKTFKKLVANDTAGDFLKKTKKRPFKELTVRELIQIESKIGARIFGPIKPGNRREFFNENPNNWIWYEEWTDSDNKRQSVTTRYEIHDDGIFKVQEGTPYQYIKGQELDNFVTAAQLYLERVARDIYKCDHKTGKPIA
ncbi:MAG: hypothetical protein PWQ10_406 [Patescibacteria group bacterium]|nr:hypothetical protein [Patescibacteria group bacterium]